MLEIYLTIESPDGTKKVALPEGSLSLGRSEERADVAINDEFLSRLHATLHHEGDRVWIVDELSTSGSLVNNQRVPAGGTPLKDKDTISIGQTTIRVHIARAKTKAQAEVNSGRLEATTTTPRATLILAGIMIVAILVGATVLAVTLLRGSEDSTSAKQRQARIERPDADNEPVANTGNPANSNAGGDASNTNSSFIDMTSTATGVESRTPVAAGRNLYLQMSEEERNEFIYEQARRVSRMMGNREYVFTDDILPYVKKYVDGYAKRVSNGSMALWGEDLKFLFGRARTLAPDIIRAFNARGVPIVVGLYIPVIECEYRECLVSPVGAKGLYQFMPATAQGYGVDPDERCNVKKMAPAAALYMKDRIAEFGTDSMSVALGIAGYNRSPDSVRRDLHDVLNSENKERSFWTLIANSDKLDRFFQGENIKYVPKFFAAAIVGENPRKFGLEMNPLSTYTATE